MLKPEVKEKWIEALLSDKYKQGHEFLRVTVAPDKVEHCCLGVLCDIIEPTSWDKDDAHCGSKLYPHASILEEIGLTQSVCESLAYRNDGAGNFKKHSFAEIAECIREKL
jgi:hypothetical protein